MSRMEYCTNSVKYFTVYGSDKDKNKVIVIMWGYG